MSAAFAIEWLKFRRSTIVLAATVLAGVGSPAMALGIVSLARSKQLTGPAQAKFAIALAGTEWEAHFALEAQILAVIMMLGGGLIVAWLYGREFVDGTFASLFALPISRTAIGLAKALLAASWSLATALLATLLTLGGSALVSSSPMDAAVLENAGSVFGGGAIMGLLGLPFGLVAVWTRGYFGAFAALLMATAASQIVASLGWGHWVPFVAPALWAGAGGPDVAATVRPIHLAVAVGFALTAALATVAWFRRLRIA
jgi:ABC-2 type transport system permease protein